MTEHRRDIRLDLKFRNNLIVERMEELGITTVAELCRQMNWLRGKQGYIGAIINMKVSPLKHNNKGEPVGFKKIVKDLAVFLRCLPEDLFSENQLVPLDKNKASMTIDSADIPHLIAGSVQMALPPDYLYLKDEEARRLRYTLRTLTPREESILLRRFGLLDDKEWTADEVGEFFGVSGKRILQIEKKALRKLKHPSRAKFLKHGVIHKPTVEEKIEIECESPWVTPKQFEHLQ